MGAVARSVLWDLVEESLDEAEFLWTSWEAQLNAHDYTIDEVVRWSEERLIGSLDGLIVGGEAAVDGLLAPALASKERTRGCAAASALVSIGSPGALAAVEHAWASGEGEILDAIRRGAEVRVALDTIGLLARRLKSAAPAALAAFLELCMQRRYWPGTLMDMEGPLNHADPQVQAACVTLARYAPHAERRLIAELKLAYPEAAVRNAAVETGMVVGAPAALQQCRALVSARDPNSQPLLQLVAMFGEETDHSRLVAALADEILARDAISALGVAGRRAGADACLALMQQDVHTRLAADAFCAITGLDLAQSGLVEKAQPVEEPVPLDTEDLDQVRELLGDEKLPLPDVAGVTRWWERERARFDDKARYHGGQPFSLQVLQHALERGPTRRRHALALEAAIRSCGSYDVRTNALVCEQRCDMQRLGALADHVRGPFTAVGLTGA